MQNNTSNKVSTPAAIPTAISMAAQQLLQKADFLISERLEGEKARLETATKAFYKDLGGFYGFYQTYKESEPADKASFMAELISKIDFSVQKNTTKLSIMLRHIVGCERKRANALSKVIRHAFDNEWPAQSFAEMLEEAGGVDKVIRLKGSSTSNNQTINLARKKVIATLQASTAIDATTNFGIAKVSGVKVSNSHVMLLGKVDTDGEVRIMGVVNDVNKGLYSSWIERKATENLPPKQTKAKAPAQSDTNVSAQTDEQEAEEAETVDA